MARDVQRNFAAGFNRQEITVHKYVTSGIIYVLYLELTFTRICKEIHTIS